MATRKAFIIFGDSLAAGSGYLSLVSTSNFQRWTGQTSLPSMTTAAFDVEVDDIIMFTPKLPYGVTTEADVTSGTGTDLQTGSSLFSASDVSRWVYVISGTGQGQHRQISAYTSATQVTVATAWTTNLSTDSVVQLWTDSMSTTGGSSTTLTWDVNAAVTALTSALVGKWVVGLKTSADANTSNTGSARKIASVSAHQITFEEAWPAAPAANFGFRILSGSGSVDDFADITSSNAALRPLRFYKDEAKTYSTGFDYPNFYQSPLIAPANHASNDAINCVPELLWRLKHHVDGPVYGLQLGQGGSTCGAYPVGTVSHGLSSLSPISWGWEITNNDWRPNATTGLYAALTAMVTAWGTLVTAAGDTLDIQGIFVHLGTNDALNDTRTELFLQNMTFLRDTFRAWLSDNGYTALSPGNIPWIMSGVGPAAGRSAANVTTCNGAMLQMEQDDPFTGYVDTTDTTVFSYAVDGVHFDEDGYIQDGVALYQKWAEVIARLTDPNVLDLDRPTLQTLRSRVKRRYERNTSGNAATAAQINGFINDSLREFYNTVGDNPWFLRRKETISSIARYPSTTTLPRTIRRIVRVEDSAYPGRMIPYQCMGFTDSGRIELSLHTASTGQVVVWHLIVPRELDGDGDRCLVPMDYVELIVVLACKRLSEAAGNVNMAAYYDAEAVRLWKYVKRNVLAHGRMSNDQMAPGDSYDAIRGGSSTDPLWGL